MRVWPLLYPLVASLLALGACTGDQPPGDDDSTEPSPFTSTLTQSVTGVDGTVNVTTAGVILNQYSALAANASAGTTQLTVTSVAELDATAVGFGALAAGDLLMVIQMQGATIDSTDTVGFGAVTNLGGAGNYELVTVASITNNVIRIVTTDCGALRNAYTTGGHAQVVRIPQIKALAVTGTGSITGRAWDGTRGGVVALQIGGTATISGAGITASAIGFRGGAVDNAASAMGITTYRDANGVNGAEKGEGIAGYQATYDLNNNGRFGRGAPANGGGGGDAHNGGGGGGANGNSGTTWTGQGVMNTTTIGAAAWALDPGFIANGNAVTTSSGGGRGGYSYSEADRDALVEGPGIASWAGDRRREVGGLGGRPVANDPTIRLFLGGGGGAGDGNNGAAGAGGAGGGIIFLVANTVTGTGAIVSNGADGTNASSNPGDAPGGAGAGGTIVIRAGTLGGVRATANGGGGGLQTLANALEAEGPGGGGGGGYIAVRGGAITRTASGGLSGTTNRAVLAEFPVNGATNGASGTADATITAISACFADLVLTMTDAPDPVLPGGTITYTLGVANTGPSTSATITVTDTLPAGVTFVSAMGAGWSCTQASGTVTCTRPLLAGMATAPISIVVTAPNAPTTSTNSAVVSASTPDFSEANNSATAMTTVSSNVANQPPVNTAPMSFTTPEDVPFVFNTGNAIQISDPDAGFANLRVTLTATNGVITIGTVGLVFTVGDGTSDATMTFTGTIAQINNALDSLTFTAPANYSGPASLTITTNDQGNTGAGGPKEDTDVIAVTVTPVNDNPNAMNDTATILTNGPPTVINVLANDSSAPDIGETLTVTAVTQPITGGTVAITSGGANVTFTPTPGFSGTVTFTYTISDGNGGTATATVTVTVGNTGVNQPPVNTAPATATTPSNTPLAFTAANLVSVADPDAGALPLRVTLLATNGTVSVAPATVTFSTGDGTDDVQMIFTGSQLQLNTALAALVFAPTTNFTGAASVTLVTNDQGNMGTGGARQDMDTIAITVTMGVNHPPIAANDTALFNEDSGPHVIDVLANDTTAPDVGETLTITAVSQPAGGTVLITGGGSTVTFTPSLNFNGNTAFTYTISDGNGGTATATVNVQVSPVNDPPTAVDDMAMVAQDAPATTIDVLANDSGAPDGVELLQITAITQPAAGAATIVVGGGSVTYMPPAGYTGTTTFTYTIRDPGGLQATAVVTVMVGGLDSDHDGLTDAYELMIGTDPNDADSDDDGVIDGLETTPGEDSDGDGLIDALDPDSDNDGLYDGTELGVTTPNADTDVTAGHFVPDADPTTHTDPRDADTDDGG